MNISYNGDLSSYQHGCAENKPQRLWLIRKDSRATRYIPIDFTSEVYFIPREFNRNSWAVLLRVRTHEEKNGDNAVTFQVALCPFCEQKPGE